MPPRGRAGFFCQSGALGSAILEKVNNRGLGLSTFVSAGNRADVSGNDLLQYWEEDDSTEVVLLYLESIGNPRKFSRIARRVSRRKPIIAVRSGRTTQGVPMGHAVRKIAAPPQAVDAMFRQAGVIQVDTLEEMFDVAQLLAHQPLPRGRRVAVVGNSDALGLLAADAAAAVGLVVNQPVALGRRRRAPRTSRTPSTRPSTTPRSTPSSAVYIPPLNVSGEEVANVLAAVGEQSDKPLVSTFLGAEGVPELLRVPDVAGSPPAAARCRRTPPSRPRCGPWPASSSTPCGCAPRTARTPTRGAVDPGRGPAAGQRAADATTPTARTSSDAELRALLAAYGIDLWEPRPVADAGARRSTAGEELGWDVVLKATADRLRERPDLAHVWRNIDTADRDAGRLGEPAAELIDDPGAAGFVVQKNAPPGVPVAIRSIEDPLFGPVVSFGISGPLTELLEDRSLPDPAAGEHDAGGDGPRDQGLADALRLPRLRGRRRRRGRGADPPGGPAPARPAAGPSLDLSLVLAGAARRDGAHRARPGSSRSPTRGRTGSCAACRRLRGGHDARAERARRDRLAHATTGETRLRAARAIDRTGYYPEVVADGVVRGGRRRGRRVVLRPPRADVRP